MNETHSFDVIVVANENVVIVMGINISIIFLYNYYCIYQYYLQIVTMAKLFGVSSANCQAEQKYPEMEKLGRYI
jgi:hypothetical protein